MDGRTLTKTLSIVGLGGSLFLSEAPAADAPTEPPVKPRRGLVSRLFSTSEAATTPVAAPTRSLTPVPAASVVLRPVLQPTPRRAATTTDPAVQPASAATPVSPAGTPTITPSTGRATAQKRNMKPAFSAEAIEAAKTPEPTKIPIARGRRPIGDRLNDDLAAAKPRVSAAGHDFPPAPGEVLPPAPRPKPVEKPRAVEPTKAVVAAKPTVAPRSLDVAAMEAASRTLETSQPKAAAKVPAVAPVAAALKPTAAPKVAPVATAPTPVVPPKAAPVVSAPKPAAAPIAAAPTPVAPTPVAPAKVAPIASAPMAPPAVIQQAVATAPAKPAASPIAKTITLADLEKGAPPRSVATASPIPVSAPVVEAALLKTGLIIPEPTKSAAPEAPTLTAAVTRLKLDIPRAIVAAKKEPAPVADVAPPKPSEPAKVEAPPAEPKTATDLSSLLPSLAPKSTTPSVTQGTKIPTAVAKSAAVASPIETAAPASVVPIIPVAAMTATPELRTVEPKSLALVPFDPEVFGRCLEVLHHGRIESDRWQAVNRIQQTAEWQVGGGVAQALRAVALNDYNTGLRWTAVQMLGSMKRDFPIVADTLRLSAQFDSDPSIRKTATDLLFRSAALQRPTP
ncbi:MAG: hypothetical protein ACRC1K_14545 [Planctomycetia bacterium]